MKSGVQWHSKAQYPTEPNEIDGVKQALEDISNTRIPVVYIKDNPRPLAEMESCLTATKGLDPAQCAQLRSAAFEDEPALTAIKQIASPLITIANLDDSYCGQDQCLPIIGNVVVYRDDNHLTNTFVKTLAPRLTEILTASIESQG